MLGLRFYACDRCDTVFADPDAPRECGECADGRLNEITHRLQADTYFLPVDER